MRIAIVIINFKTAELVTDCLASLAQQCISEDVRVWVVDNCSGDDSVPKLSHAIEQRGWAGWTRLVESKTNGGFAAGNNLAIRSILALPERPEFVLLLNPDTLVRSKAINSLVTFLDEHPHVGLAGSRLEDPDGQSQRSAFRFPSILSELEEGMRLGITSKLLNGYRVPMEVSDQPHKCDWVAGASVLVRTAVFDAIGLLNEDYFMYYEEVDFTLRAASAGWDCWYVPQSRVVHLVGQSSGLATSRRPTKRMPRYWFESRAQYFDQHHGRFYRILANIAWSAGHLTFRLRNLIQRKPTNDPPRLFSDFVAFNFSIKASS